MITLLGVGFNHTAEAARVDAWLSANLRGDDLAVCYSTAMAPLIQRARPYNEVFSQTEELELFARAYALKRELDAFVAPRVGPLGRMVLDAYHHAWARDLYWFCGISHLEETRGRVACVIDHPYPSQSRLPRGWKYLHMSTMPRAYPLDEAMRALAGGRPALFEASLRRLGPQSLFGELPAVDPERGRVLVPIDDTGSMVNLTSAQAVIAALQDEGVEPIVLTSSVAVNDALRPRCQVQVLDDEPPPAVYAAVVAELRQMHAALDALVARDDAVHWKLFVSLNKPRLTAYMSDMGTLDAGLPRLVDSFDMRLALAINEGGRLPSGTIHWFRERGLETVGVTPILLMDHPTCHDWPAHHHLVYGDQAAELLRRCGVAAEDVHVVGSEHFDRCVRRSAGASAAWVREAYPRAAGKKLVVVATEARPRQMLEIEPTLEVLARMEDVHTIVKLHPDDRPAQFAPLLERLGTPPHLEMVERTDLHALLQSMDLMITMGSNLIVEAAAMQRPTLIFNFSGTPCPIDFVAEGICYGATSAAELETRVRLLLFDADVQAQARARLALITRFNGPNDGRSAARIARFTAARLAAAALQ